MPPAPRLASVSTGTLLVTPVRLVLGGAVIGGAVAEGLSRDVVLVVVALGVVLPAVVGTSSRRRALSGNIPVAPADARYCTWWESCARAALPSTVGLTILGAVALGFSRGLAAVCGGLVVGMGILGLATALILLADERREQHRLYVDWSILHPHRFVTPR